MKIRNQAVVYLCENIFQAYDMLILCFDFDLLTFDFDFVN